MQKNKCNDNLLYLSLQSEDEKVRQAAKESFVRKYSVLILRYAMTLTKHNKLDAEDITNELITNILEMIEEKPTTKIKNFRSYVYRSVRNIYVNMKAKNSPQFLDQESIENISQNNTDIYRKIDIEDAQDTLPDDKRELFTLKCLEGFSYREIKKIINSDKTEDALKMEVYRIRNYLQSLLIEGL